MDNILSEKLPKYLKEELGFFEFLKQVFDQGKRDSRKGVANPITVSQYWLGLMAYEELVTAAYQAGTKAPDFYYIHHWFKELRSQGVPIPEKIKLLGLIKEGAI